MIFRGHPVLRRQVCRGQPKFRWQAFGRDPAWRAGARRHLHSTHPGNVRFRAPDGLLIEIATDVPGSTLEEAA